MACVICGALNHTERVYEYGKPDKYEAYMGIDDVDRVWLKCVNCGQYRQERNYDLSQLEAIYAKGYRDREFRGETIQEAYERIRAIPWTNSENKNRADWFNTHFYFTATEMRVLDVGAGLGVFPALLREYGYNVECQEENQDSIDHIWNNLGIVCYEQLSDTHYDAVSLVHVLEHIRWPDAFLMKMNEIADNVFIEVPDAMEFGWLDKSHDEFNSCHLHFFTMENLIRLVERNGFIVDDVSRKYYPGRSLSRLLLVAHAA